MEIRATLSWDGRGDAPADALLPAAPDGARLDLAEAALSGGTARGISGTLRALTERDLGAALERVMRDISVAAALSDAVLEMRARRVAPPRAAPPDALQALALDLWTAGFSVRFAPSWTPAPAGAVGLGLGGAGDGLRGFLADHPSWKMA